MSVIIENPWTKETRVLEPLKGGGYHMPPTPWRVKGTTRISPATAKLSTIAVMASEHGVPMSQFLSGVRWLLGMQCPYCQVAGQFLGLLEHGKIGKSEAMVMIGRVLEAKANNDTAKLEELKGWLKS